ncbi:hypothetical protein JQ629_01895 [Bradyrhizobium sp. AUGA SZCCT0222]|nr:hypothetical protein [Bradyrhizobium sp. AUGA SZCCT0222]
MIHIPLGQYLVTAAWRKSPSGVLDGPATPVFWNVDKSEGRTRAGCARDHRKLIKTIPFSNASKLDGRYRP